MRPWNQVVSVPVGGLVAVGFLDEQRVIVGSHSGVGVFDAETGARLERLTADDYSWYQADPPSFRRLGPAGIELVPSEGLWGGRLLRSSSDGWTSHQRTDGIELIADDFAPVVILDAEERRGHGFSAEARTFVYATSATLNILYRTDS